MLEQQQGQLVSGLQELYRRLLAGQAWNGTALSESNGHPLTHDILAALNLLEIKRDGRSDAETFEEDCQKLQAKFIANGAPFIERRGSFSSDSDHSRPGRSTVHRMPTTSKQSIFKESFKFRASPSPVVQSPVPSQRHSFPPAHQSPLHHATQMIHDPQLFQQDWTLSEMNSPEPMMRSNLAIQGPQLLQNLDDVASILYTNHWSDSPGPYDLSMSGFTSYPHQLSNAFATMPGIQEFVASAEFDAMDMDFSKYIQVVT
jgi:hypothetical protein